MTDSSMHSRAVSLSFEPYVLGATHHWQKWNESSFPPWICEHKTLPRISDTRISVRGGLLVAGIPQTRRYNMAPKTGRMECIIESNFEEPAVRGQWGQGWEIDVAPPVGRKRCCRALVGCGERRQSALSVLVWE